MQMAKMMKMQNMLKMMKSMTLEHMIENSATDKNADK